MERTSSTPPNPKTKDYSSLVDSSRPFRSVKEAVAIFGERILNGDMLNNSPKPYYTPTHEFYSWRFPSPSPSSAKEEDIQENGFLGTLKKLEAELEETKAELKLLKERESETEVALASLNAELHKNMSKLAEAEAVVAKREVEMRIEKDRKEIIKREEERRREMVSTMEDSPTLAEILSLGDEKGYFGGKRKVVKKKPIVPLFGHLFFKKKGSVNSANNNSLHSSPNLYFN